MNQKTKLIIGGVLIAVVAFCGGIAVASSGKKGPTTPEGGMAGGRGNFAGGMQGARGGAAAGGFVNGTVLSKTENSITVQNQAGGSKIILVSPTTSVSKSSEGSLTDVAVGSSVLATGSTNSDGSITAQTLQLRPEGAGKPAQR